MMFESTENNVEYQCAKVQGFLAMLFLLTKGFTLTTAFRKRTSCIKKQSKRSRTKRINLESSRECDEDEC